MHTKCHGGHQFHDSPAPKNSDHTGQTTEIWPCFLLDGPNRLCKIAETRRRTSTLELKTFFSRSLRRVSFRKDTHARDRFNLRIVENRNPPSWRLAKPGQSCQDFDTKVYQPRLHVFVHASSPARDRNHSLQGGFRRVNTVHTNKIPPEVEC